MSIRRLFGNPFNFFFWTTCSVLTFIGIVIYGITGCSTRSRLPEGSALYTFVDSIPASKKIIDDDIEGYFSQLTKADMSIQMKTPIRDSARINKKVFQQFLTREVANWRPDEKEKVAATLDKAITLVKQLNPDCLTSFGLIKIRGNHYGKDVYYTRGANIFIPENIFDSFEEEEQLPIFIHEIFHIISKNHENYRQEMYGLIGFTKLPAAPMLPEVLSNRLLTNPDGVTRQYAINLGEKTGTGVEKWAIPLITASPAGYQDDKPNFFDYLKFDVYEVEEKKGTWRILAKANGESTLPLTSTPRFFTQIKDNTQYIIHPEEIMADNFMLAVLACHKNDYSRFSKEGKMLIEQVISCTRNYSFQ